MSDKSAAPAAVAVLLAEALETRDLLFVANDEGRAASIASILAAFAPGARVAYLPSSDALPGEDAPASPANIGARAAALRDVRRARGESVRVALVTTAEATVVRYASPDAFDAAPPAYSIGSELDLAGFADLAREIGYLEDDRVDEPGEVAVRGSVLDIFPVDSALPVRIEVQDGQVTSIKRYDPVTQLGTEELDSIEIGRASEPEASSGGSLLDHLPEGAVALDDKAKRRRDRFLRLSEDALKRRHRSADPLVSTADWDAALDARE